MKLLSHNEYADIISWLPHGQSFIIHDRKKLKDMVLPKFFQGTKFNSFTRKLNRWRFERIARGMEAGAFKHEVSEYVLDCIISILISYYLSYFKETMQRFARK